MRFPLLATASLALASCSGNKEDNQVTETRMDDIDSLEGTISDDAINMDESTDEAPVEAAPPATDTPKTKLDKSAARETGGPDKAQVKAEEPAAE